MKKNNLILAFLALVLVFTSCKNENDVYTKIIDFEDVVLNEDSIWNGSDTLGTPANETMFGFPVTRITSYNVCYTKLLRGWICSKCVMSWLITNRW